MKKWLTILGVLFSYNCYAISFSLDECVESSTWIAVVAGTRDHSYEQLEDEIRNHLDGYLAMFPKKVFLKSFADHDYFFGALRDAYDSKQPPDEVQTNYINNCIENSKPSS